ncbi:hypothetical protein DFP72DRAFT_1146427 [Ephemerocybe angulata]|uniref:Uncharacterized protein n=1 Tax=Ephemerocybe angulata TaxID=980116 RepID=A0A8H6LZZ0_9AGAR|nr:hypothetical protein DFP72DRAFT_1146427 [Tulosesus angulatus]
MGRGATVRGWAFAEIEADSERVMPTIPALPLGDVTPLRVLDLPTAINHFPPRYLIHDDYGLNYEGPDTPFPESQPSPVSDPRHHSRRSPPTARRGCDRAWARRSWVVNVSPIEHINVHEASYLRLAIEKTCDFANCSIESPHHCPSAFTRRACTDLSFVVATSAAGPDLPNPPPSRNPSYAQEHSFYYSTSPSGSPHPARSAFSRTVAVGIRACSARRCNLEDQHIQSFAAPVQHPTPKPTAPDDLRIAM